MSKVIIVIVALLVVGSCSFGLNSGRSSAAARARAEVRRNYAPQLDSLTAELNTLIRNSDNRIQELTRNHNTRINQLTEQHNSRVNQITNDHNINLQRTKDTSFAAGERDMRQRIGEIYDLDISNWETARVGWNETIEIIR